MRIVLDRVGLMIDTIDPIALIDEPLVVGDLLPPWEMTNVSPHYSSGFEANVASCREMWRLRRGSEGGVLDSTLSERAQANVADRGR